MEINIRIHLTISVLFVVFLTGWNWWSWKQTSTLQLSDQTLEYVCHHISYPFRWSRNFHPQKTNLKQNQKYIKNGTINSKMDLFALSIVRILFFWNPSSTSLKNPRRNKSPPGCDPKPFASIRASVGQKSSIGSQLKKLSILWVGCVECHERKVLLTCRRVAKQIL